MAIRAQHYLYVIIILVINIVQISGNNPVNSLTVSLLLVIDTVKKLSRPENIQFAIRNGNPIQWDPAGVDT